MNKKILLVCALLLAASFSYSQSLTLSFNGQVLNHNEQIMLMGTPDDPEIISEIAVTNNSSNYLIVKAKKVENYLISGSMNTFCWAGQCFSPAVYISPVSDTIFAGETNENGFSGHYEPLGYAGQSSITYTFYDINNVSDSVSVIVVYNASLTGIGNKTADVTLSAPYPNPARNFVNFDYSIQDLKNTHISIYSLVGSMVQDIAITESSNTLKINTANIEEGFYFYKLYSGNQEIKTGKFIVRH